MKEILFLNALYLALLWIMLWFWPPWLKPRLILNHEWVLGRGRGSEGTAQGTQTEEPEPLVPAGASAASLLLFLLLFLPHQHLLRVRPAPAPLSLGHLAPKVLKAPNSPLFAQLRGFQNSAYSS